MENWSELYNDILGLIVDQLSAIEDIVHFGAVCRPWRLVSVEKLHLSMVYPWLMLAEKEDSDTRGFYSLSTRKVYHLNLPEARGRQCWSSCGWLITFGLDLEIHLLNPFSRVQIRLPPQPTIPFYIPEDLCMVFMAKIILSSRPSLSVKTTSHEDDECVAMAICSGFDKLAFSRLRDEVWTPLDGHSRINDVIYFNGQFYAVNRYGKLLICDISSFHPKTVEFADPPEFADQPEGINHIYTNYLVESLGELFMIARELVFRKLVDNLYLTTNVFYVYKFNFDDRKWTKVKSLDNRAMFVGANNSFDIFPSDHPGCEPNCIYFTDDNKLNLYNGDNVHDVGVFHIEAQEIGVHYDGPDMLSSSYTPIWFSPSL